MNRIAALVGLAGAATATAIVVWAGIGPVVAAFAAAGAGVAGASAFHLVPMILNARAWQLLVGRSRSRSLATFAWLVWLREAINGLLPVARVGGEVITARLLVRRGVRPVPAVASLVMDITVGLATQVLFTVAGLGLLAARHPGSALARPAWLGLAAVVLSLAAVAWLQRSGALPVLGRVARYLTGGRLGDLSGSTRCLDRVLAVLWRRRARLLRCAAWQLAGWVTAAGEIWIFLRAAGAPISVADAILLESLVQAFASAAFVVPAALGVQEGVFLALGQAVGLSPQVALALALARRARDILVYVPALALWQAREGRRMLGEPRSGAVAGGVAPRPGRHAEPGPSPGAFRARAVRVKNGGARA